MKSKTRWLLPLSAALLFTFSARADEPTPPAEPPPTAPATPPTEPPATPPTEPAEPSEPVESDPLLEIIRRDLNPNPEPPIEPAPEGGSSAIPPAEPPPAAPPAEPPPAAPPAQPAPEPPKKKAVKSIAKGNPLIETPPPAPAPSATPPTPPAAAPADTLSEEQRDEIAEAEVAERLFPHKYKGHAERLRQFYSTFDTRAQALMAQNPNLTEEDEEYQKLLNSKPTISQGDYRKVLKTTAAEESERRVEQKLAPKFAKVEMEAKFAQLNPAVQDFVNNTFQAGVRQLVLNDAKSVLAEPLKVAMEKGQDAARAEFPLEFEIMRETADTQRRRVAEFLLLKNNARAFDPKNQTHAEIADFINREGQLFQEKGGKYLAQQGRTFLPRSEFIALLQRGDAEAKTFDAANWRTARYWTFTDAAIVDMMAIRTKEEAENRIQFEQERATKLGFQRAPKKPVANPQTPPAKPVAEITPPKAAPSAAPSPTPPLKTPANDNSPIPLASIVSSLKMVR